MAETTSSCRNGSEPLGKNFLPSPDFSTFVLSLGSSALLHLGETPDPETGRPNIDLPMAKHIIDTLCILQQKTTGNLTPEEERLLADLIYELRVIFVRLTP